METLELNADQLRCMASPVRNEALTLIRSRREASAREIGDAMGMSPEAMLYHLKKLEAVGLIREKYRRPAPRKPESVFEMVADRLNLPDLSENPGLAKVVAETVAEGQKVATRGYLQAAEKALAGEGDKPTVWRVNAKLSSKDAEKFRNLIEEAIKFATSSRVEDGDRVHFAALFFPLA